MTPASPFSALTRGGEFYKLGQVKNKFEQIILTISYHLSLLPSFFISSTLDYVFALCHFTTSCTPPYFHHKPQ